MPRSSASHSGRTSSTNRTRGIQPESRISGRASSTMLARSHHPTGAGAASSNRRQARAHAMQAGEPVRSANRSLRKPRRLPGKSVTCPGEADRGSAHICAQNNPESTFFPRVTSPKSRHPPGLSGWCAGSAVRAEVSGGAGWIQTACLPGSPLEPVSPRDSELRDGDFVLATPYGSPHLARPCCQSQPATAARSASWFLNPISWTPTGSPCTVNMGRLTAGT